MPSDLVEGLIGKFVMGFTLIEVRSASSEDQDTY